MSDNANKCIACTVTECTNHCDTSDYCSLNAIRIGTHEYDPAKSQCTDCKSFRRK